MENITTVPVPNWSSSRRWILNRGLGMNVATTVPSGINRRLPKPRAPNAAHSSGASISLRNYAIQSPLRRFNHSLGNETHTLVKPSLSSRNLVKFWCSLVQFGGVRGVAAMAVAMRPLTARIALLRRLAALSHCPQQVAPSSSIPRGCNLDVAVPTIGKVWAGYGAFVREYQSEVSVSPSASVSQESPAAVAGEYAIRNEPRNDWTREEIQAIYESPLMDLLFYGAQAHKHTHKWREVQQCTLLSIKTGGCSEDCSYCPQSSRYDTGVKAQKLLSEDIVLEAAKKAKEAGSSRFCMGAAWRDTVGRKTNFNQILEYVKEIRGMGMEVCCTLGMLEQKQAEQLKTAGLTAYNHNLDTSREYYPNIITTRSYDERLKTLELVRDAGISVCSGGIIGLGEAEEDRVGLLHTLATLPEHPESVPINALLAVKGTPLENQKPVEVWEMVRMIATARIVMPRAMVRLSAGRVRFSQPEQALCFMAGANSIFTGEKLLTTPNNDKDADQQMFQTLGLIPKPPNFNQGHSSSVDERIEVAAVAA